MIRPLGSPQLYEALHRPPAHLGSLTTHSFNVLIHALL